MAKLVKISILGDLGDSCGKEWNLDVKSAMEAFAAIETLSGNFSRYFFQYPEKRQAKYRILINGKDFNSPVKKIDESNQDMICQSELIMKKNNLETIDIVPFVESNDPVTAALVILAVAVAAAVTTYLLARPPTFGSFRPIPKSDSASYLFGGPVNIIGEGGPVPLGYGRLLVGSHVISSAYKVVDYQTHREASP